MRLPLPQVVLGPAVILGPVLQIAVRVAPVLHEDAFVRFLALDKQLFGCQKPVKLVILVYAVAQAALALGDVAQRLVEQGFTPRFVLKGEGPLIDKIKKSAEKYRKIYPSIEIY